MKLSVVLATRNEEKNIKDCLLSVKEIADEVIVVDEYSTDKTREIAEGLGAKVFKESHHDIFHVTKQKALERATGDWILQLDADERVTKELSEEIKRVLVHPERARRVEGRLKNKLKLFRRHQKLVEKRDGPIGRPSGEIVGYFIPRVNFFLGKPLIHAGVYPDGVVRLVRKGKARFPQKSVHEQVEVDGEVAWLFNALEHHDSPTFERYLSRLNRYTDLIAKDLKREKVRKSISGLIYFSTVRPLSEFLKLYVRHLGFLDGMRGFVWSLFSSFRFPISYFKYYRGI